LLVPYSLATPDPATGAGLNGPPRSASLEKVPSVAWPSGRLTTPRRQAPAYTCKTRRRKAIHPSKVRGNPMNPTRRDFLAATAAGLSLLGAPPTVGAAQPAVRPRVTFTRVVAHWAEYADPEYLSFIAEARPEVAQVGFYGGHFWSLAHTPHGKG